MLGISSTPNGASSTEMWAMTTAERILTTLGIPHGQIYTAGAVQADVARALDSIKDAGQSIDDKIDAAVTRIEQCFAGTFWQGATSNADAVTDLRSMLRQHFNTVSDLAQMTAGDTVAGISSAGAKNGGGSWSGPPPDWAQELLDVMHRIEMLLCQKPD